MSASLFEDLAWLPVVPADFRERCRGANDARDFVRLASYALDESQLRHLAAALEAIRSSNASLPGLTPFTLSILGNATLDSLLPALTATALRYGIALRCVKAEFGETFSAASDPGSEINRANPDAVLCAIDYRGLPLKSAGDGIAAIQMLREAIRKNSGAGCILQTLAPPPESLFGSLDRSVPGTLRSVISEWNRLLVESTIGSGDLILDVAAIAETVGLANWYSPTQWNIAKFAFDPRYLPLYADHICRLIAAVRGRSRRCLILDLDNTIWGGVIGDDGLEGIVIGQGDATGEAYLEVQRMALSLRERGIVLAVCSKNQDDIARSAFIKHPEMLLRENHIAVFQANWDDKPANIAAIAKELSLGLDAMVFVDDSPAERAFVREALPEVAVPELPEDPALYARTLLAAGYFETVTYTEEDRKRAEFYEGNARRAALVQQIGDIESYLRSLQMTITFAPFDAIGRSRIVQLINKSNQFNLTTRRYTDAEINALERDASIVTLQVRLADMFGDNGMIGVVICRPKSNEDWTVDTWLMSCRVLGRRVEQMVLRELIRQARERGIKRLIGRFIPSGRNQLVQDHYAKLGFRLTGEEPSGTTTWELETATEIEPAPMVVEYA